MNEPGNLFGPTAKRLRILHVVPTYFPAVRYGGPIRVVHGLAREQAANGHDVHVYTTSVDGPHDIDVPDGEVVELDGVHVHYFRVPRLRRLYWAPALAKTLRLNIRDFDIVHLHGVYLWPTWVAAQEAAIAGVPYVITPHGQLVRELIRRKSRWIKTAWIKLIEHENFRHASAIHVTSKAEAEEIQALGLPVCLSRKILFGLDLPSRHLPLEAGPFKDIPRPYALFLSRINWKKGLERLLIAWKQVPDLHLVVAGNDEENYLPKLQELATAARVSDRVHFVGPADDAAKWALYENAEMFVLPSLNENFGVVVAEAMAMACPVVLSTEVGIAPLVIDAEAGVVTSGEPEAFSAAVRGLRADSERRRRMGANGRAAIGTTLTWSACATQMEALYRSVCTNPVMVEHMAGSP